MRVCAWAFVFGSLAAATFASCDRGTPADSVGILNSAGGVTCPPPDGTRPDPTLVNVDPFVLARFPLKRVLNQLITLAGTAPQTPTDLYRQLWDATDKAPGLFPASPHCDDPGAINDFAVACPAPDSFLKKGDHADFSPVALFNRFDLAPADGSNCGEYRIVYARKGNSVKGISGRDFIIFEGILPNPDPKCGLEACRPVVTFWENLASFNPTVPADQLALANALDEFYFTGLKGFEPVVHPKHYGAGLGDEYAGGPGQVRLNMFFAEQRWRLREDHLVTVCDKSCRLEFQPVTVKNNPFPDLFNAASPESRMPAFQGDFPFSQTAGLATDDVNTIALSIDDKMNAGESNASIIGPACGPAPAQNDDDNACVGLGSPPNTFTNDVDAQLVSLTRTDLTSSDVFKRATTQTCAGCHEISNNVNLGGSGIHPNLVWPRSRKFVHVDESSFLSQALWCVFLPNRKNILDGFFASPPAGCALGRAGSSRVTISGHPIGAAN